MTAITQPFSSANTTVRIFPNSTVGQQGALGTLRSNIALAMALALTDPGTAQTNRETYFTAFETASNMSAATVTFTGTSGGAASNVDGAVQGTWTQTSSGATGTWSSTASAAASTSAVLTLTSGTPTTVSGATTGFTFTTTVGAIPTGTAAYAISLTAGTGAGSAIGKITAIGDTGVEVATIEVKLLNESGTSKDTGSSNEGTTTIDYLDVPSDAGQALMFAARNDRSSNKNRVFKLTHNSSGQVKWLVGIVSTIKTTEGAVDAMITNKATILIQDGLTIVNPA
jgi:hypothetical protein